MKLRSIAAAIGLSAMLTIPLAGCQDSMLTQSGRDKLQTVLDVADGVVTVADGTLLVYQIACPPESTDKICVNAVVKLAATAVSALSDSLHSGIHAAKVALADGTPNEKLAQIAADLRAIKDRVQQAIQDFKIKQKAELESEKTVIEQAKIPPYGIPDIIQPNG